MAERNMPAVPKKTAMHCLMIVESPHKADTINKFLGSNFTVKASKGHVRDLPQDELGVDEEHDFKPKYVPVPGAQERLRALKAAAKKSDIVYLATDPDREGEAISWHLMETLKDVDVPFKRLSFHEITKSAVTEALKNPRDLDANLIDAQQARRIIDRLVGYKLSPLLWNKIKSGLSAGRVQSVTLRFVAERAKEIAAFNEEDYYTLSALLSKSDSAPFGARLVKWNGKTVEQTKTLKLFAEEYKYKTSLFKRVEETVEAATLLRGSVIKVSKVEAKKVRQKPKPPFITSTLQQDAYSKLRFSSDRTMKIAQVLYEGIELGKGQHTGLITYMRTDSFEVSAEMRKETEQFIKETYGEDYCPAKPNIYKKKVKGAQEAHESIHPTSAFRRPEDLKKFLTDEQYKLYSLIWSRFVASQMSEAIFDQLTVEFSDENEKALLRTSGRTVKFPGYLKIYRDDKEKDEEADEEDEGKIALPPLKEGDIVALKDVDSKAHRTSAPPSYNNGSLIKIMEKHGIGRPSTYAAIIKNIIGRGYITEAKDGKYNITELGALVTEQLKDYFKDIMDIAYTASIEDKLDDVADGKINWVRLMHNFYDTFSANLSNAVKKMPSKRPGGQLTEEKCPLCGSQMVMRESRFGKYLSCSHFPKCKGKIALDREGNKKEYFSPIETSKVCDKCGKNKMLLRKSAKGYFLACSGFPKCRNISQVTSEEVDEILAAAAKNKK